MQEEAGSVLPTLFDKKVHEHQHPVKGIYLFINLILPYSLNWKTQNGFGICFQAEKSLETNITPYGPDDGNKRVSNMNDTNNESDIDDNSEIINIEQQVSHNNGNIHDLKHTNYENNELKDVPKKVCITRDNTMCNHHTPLNELQASLKLEEGVFDVSEAGKAVKACLTYFTTTIVFV